MGLYAFTYTTFIALEFSLYEVLLQAIEQKTKQKGLLSLITNTQPSTNSKETDAKHKTHHSSDVIFAGVFAGSIAGFATNSVEFLAVNK